MTERRCLGHRGEVIGGGIIGREFLGEDACHRDDQHQCQAESAQRLTAAKTHCARPDRGSKVEGIGIKYGNGHWRLDQLKRMRGSSQAYSRSTTRLVNTNTATVSMTNAWVSV